MRSLLLILLVWSGLTACSATRYVVTPAATLMLTAATEVNPDLQGRASPVEVKIYELAARTVFDSLDFQAAWDNGEAVLGAHLLSTATLTLLPGESRELRLELQPEANFVAVVAAFRAIDEAEWKRVVSVNSDWFQRRRLLLTDNRIEPLRKSAGGEG